MGLEIPGVEHVDTPEKARSHARRWKRMASEIQRGATTEGEQAKARELNQRAEAAYRWAREQEAALEQGQQVHEAELKKVVPLRRGQGAPPTRHRRVRRAAAAAGNAAYRSARPPALRLAHRGKQHFFQGVDQAVSPAGDVYDLIFEGLGLTLAIVGLGLLLRAPNVIGETSKHTLGFVNRAVDTVDPLTGVRLAPPAPSRAGSTHKAPAAPAASHQLA